MNLTGPTLTFEKQRAPAARTKRPRSVRVRAIALQQFRPFNHLDLSSKKTDPRDERRTMSPTAVVAVTVRTELTRQYRLEPNCSAKTRTGNCIHHSSPKGGSSFSAEQNPGKNSRIPRVRESCHRVGRTTIANILKANGIDPAPERGKRTTWSQFLKAHWDVLAAADFFTVEVWCPRGLITFYVFFAIELATRRIDIVGITPGPNEAWMLQAGRNLTDTVDGFLAGKQFLILDRDTKYSAAFRDLLKDAGVEAVRLPPRSPNLNAFAERFVLSIKEECLNRMIFFNERSLRKATREFAAHYHTERNHQGLKNRLIEQGGRNESPFGALECVQRLGGMLRFYHRAAA